MPPLVDQLGVFPENLLETRPVFVICELCVSLSKERALFLFTVGSFLPLTMFLFPEGTPR